MMIAVHRRANILVGVAVVLGLTTALTPLVWDKFYAPREYQRVSLDQLGKFNLDPDRGVISDVPKWIRQLDRKRVVTTGRVLWPGVGGRISGPQFCYDVGPQGSWPGCVQDRVFLTIRSGTAVPPLTPTMTAQVYGTLHVCMKCNDQGTIVSLYELDVDWVACPPDQEPAAWWMGGALVTGLIGLLALVDGLVRLHVHRAREMVGRCRECGYDLRASGERCPECGTPIRPCSESLLLPNSWTPSASAPER